MNLLAVSGSRFGSKTSVVLRRVVAALLQRRPDTVVTWIDLKTFDLPFCDGRPPSEYEGTAAAAIEYTSDADMVLIGSPVFNGSITGALKNWFDLLPPRALRHKAVGLVATGGTFQHYLVIEHQLRPILSYFRAYVAPGHVFAHSDHFDGNGDLCDSDVLARIGELAQEMIELQSISIAKSAHLVSGSV